MRQRYLAARREVIPDIARGIYPFRDEAGGSYQLTRADVEWLLATHESKGVRGPVRWSAERDKPLKEQRQGLDLRGARLQAINLSELPLARTLGGFLPSTGVATPQQREAARVLFQEANLRAAELQGSFLDFGHLERTDLTGVHLEHADLTGIHLEGADLTEAYLVGADLREGHFEGANLVYAQLSGADLRGAYFDPGSVLNFVQIRGTRLADVRWGGVSLIGIEWQAVRRLGDEEKASPEVAVGRRPSSQTRAERILNYQAAVRACRQLSTLLGDQGLDDQADRFAYRAEVMQRRVLRAQGRVSAYFGSLLIDLVAGYGLRPARLIFVYLAVLIAYAGAYYGLSQNGYLLPLTWYEALGLSIQVVVGRSLPTASGSAIIGVLQTVADTEVIVSVTIGFIFGNAAGRRFFGR